MSSLISCLEYIQPHESLRDEFHSFIYLSDPIETGDIKVASVVHHKGILRNSFILRWETCNPTAPEWSETYFLTVEDLKEFMILSLPTWWEYCGPRNTDED